MISKKFRLRRATRRESNCFRLYTFDDFCHYKSELANMNEVVTARSASSLVTLMCARSARAPLRDASRTGEDSKQVWNHIRFISRTKKTDQKTTEALVKMPELFVVF